MNEIKLKDGSSIPRFGLGTWYLGEKSALKEAEKAALRQGLDNGVTLIDTAEMYGGGLSERLIGEVIRDYDREKLYIVSKVLPSNAGRRGMEMAVDGSLKRLGTDYLDMYLYHWRGRIPLSETVAELERLVSIGKIRRWGVSNLDVEDMEELLSVPGGKNCMVNQVLYHLGSRGIEKVLLPWLKAHDIPVMAYCPLAQGGDLKRQLLSDKSVAAVAAKYGVTPIQVLLAFVMARPEIIAIPRSGKAEHVKANMEAAELVLDREDMELLDRAFPAPSKRTWLDIV